MEDLGMINEIVIIQTNSLNTNQMTPEQIADFQAIADKYTLTFSVLLTPVVPVAQTINFAPGVPSVIV